MLKATYVLYVCMSYNYLPRAIKDKGRSTQQSVSQLAEPLQHGQIARERIDFIPQVFRQ